MEKLVGLRFAFDLGTSSIGWAVYKLGQRTNTLGGMERDVPVELIHLGVNLFSDGKVPKTGESLASIRRVPRGARRRRDRFLQRRKHVLSLLQKHGLLPAHGNELDELFKLNPYAIRAEAVTSVVPLYQFGRAIYHLNQRRGFKSNRKAPAGEDESSGKIAIAAEKLNQLLQDSGFATIGQFLASRQSSDDVRQRDTTRVKLSGKGALSNYEFYPMRSMVESEFNQLWSAQSHAYAELSDEAYKEIHQAVFFQRPLKPVLPGRCTFFPDEFRLSDASESAQEFRIYQMVNNLRIIHQRSERALSLEERDRLADKLIAGETLTWTKVRRLLGIDSSYQINLQEGGEKDLKGNIVALLMQGKKSKQGPFFGEWLTMPENRRREIIDYLQYAEEDESVIAWAMSTFDWDHDRAQKLSNIRLPDSYRRLSAKAVDLILDRLKETVCTYSEAVAQCGLDHSDLDGNEYYTRLPFYNRVPSVQRYLGRSTGNPEDPPDIRYGRITNPTVHIGLNQLRKTCNALLDRYGQPSQIVIELARELKQSDKQKKETAERIKKNREANDERRERLEDMNQIEQGQTRIGYAMSRLQLWDELGTDPKLCPYTGKPISLTDLFSSKVEIEHILPFSRTLDDSPANKTVAFREANRVKRNLAPAEAARQHPDVIDLQAMQARVRLSGMPANKRWRFEDDAMSRFDDEEQFHARQLNETQYLSRVARTYLSTLFARKDENEQERKHVWVVPGRMTSLLRKRYSVNLGTNNQKSRNDHRHHAIDAAVVGVVDRSLIQRIADASAKREIDGVDRLLADMELPYPEFRNQVLDKVDKILVTNRARHLNRNTTDSRNTSGKLHEETYYGMVANLPENDTALSLGNVVRRKPVTSLTVPEVSQIRDEKLRSSLQAELCINPDTRKSSLAKKEIEQRLSAWSESNQIYRIRVLKKESSIIPIHCKKTGNPYKAVVPAENVYMDIYEDAKGNWKGLAMDSFRANADVDEASDYPGTFLFRIYKGDYLQLRDPETNVNDVMRVYQLKIASRVIVLANVNEAGVLQSRHDDKDDAFRYEFASIPKLKSRAARRVRFTAAGRMKTIPHGKI